MNLVPSAPVCFTWQWYRLCMSNVMTGSTHAWVINGQKVFWRQVHSALKAHVLHPYHIADTSVVGGIESDC